MKKLRFAIQVSVLGAAFPVLFIAGITYPKNETGNNDVKKEMPVIIQGDEQVKSFGTSAGSWYVIRA